MARSITIRALATPEVWEAVAREIGERPYTYDLGDSSHRLDVVQIVCEAMCRRFGGPDDGLEEATDA